MDTRISLTEASRRAPAILERGDSLLLDEGAPPTLNDLAGALQFALGDGRIWLNDERMVMLSTNVLGTLRAKMIQDVGMDRTREACMQVGWAQGVQLAELVAKRFKQKNVTAALAAGPRLHTMKGYAKVVTKRFEFDASKKEYLGEFHWHDSVEGTEYVRHIGICDCPVCWMQVAVPSGYTSTLLGYPVIFREMECVGQGAARCVVIGKDADSWGDEVSELDTFGIRGRSPAKSGPWVPPSDFTVSQGPALRDMDSIVGKSASIQRAQRLVDKVAAFREPVLLMGETGTGKEHFARYLHKCGVDADGPFVPVNCSAFTGTPEAEAETLFGASGLLKKGHGGTLFLNDFVALPAGMQAKLALELHDRDRTQRPYRIVAATGVHPLDAVTEGALRADLQYFLSVLPIQIPPLRERRDDIPELIKHFLNLHRARHSKPLDGLTGPLYDMLLRYDYPGNLRELSNLIERGVIYAEPGGMIDIAHVFSVIERAPQNAGRVHKNGGFYRPKPSAEVYGSRTLEDIEVEAVRSALIEADWNVSGAARRLGLSRAKLDYRMKKFGIERDL
ncbi:MAG: XylR N-terminal domain-containing protein [Sediminimonas sp.]|uniref:sigma-54-dependent Fis family transcriptional regulator n=1 Tax=Sediminimonas sp. TaxID=2823379 RepID=UPI002870199F|nr:XylR N-terminal domain-containing protein [Sediminimonas sp.]MDR9484190.1 XylR N-terminal domain-containing protein [Sediminimonas sp.]